MVIPIIWCYRQLQSPNSTPLADSDDQRPCFLKNLSVISAEAAAMAPPDRKLCNLNLDVSNPIDSKADSKTSLVLVYDNGLLPLSLKL